MSLKSLLRAFSMFITKILFEEFITILSLNVLILSWENIVCLLRIKLNEKSPFFCLFYLLSFLFVFHWLNCTHKCVCWYVPFCICNKFLLLSTLIGTIQMDNQNKNVSIHSKISCYLFPCDSSLYHMWIKERLRTLFAVLCTRFHASCLMNFSLSYHNNKSFVRFKHVLL